MTSPHLTIRHESPPERCEICHQADQFDPQTGVCQRCAPLLDRSLVAKAQIPSLPQPFQSVLESHLTMGEGILWTGQPARWHAIILTFFASLLFFLPLLLVGGFFSSLSKGWIGINLVLHPVVLLLWSGIAVLLMYLQWKKNCSTYYVVTDRKLAYLEGKSITKIRLATPTDLHHLECLERKSGSGSLYWKHYGADGGTQDEPAFRGFENIERVHEVKMLIQRQLLRTTPFPGDSAHAPEGFN
ncbi:MAG: hypothetical protein K1Y36_19755 [Blastocatellia bacterium]|nr:hypothetical protein [Blastocatellia bacterium]